MTALASAFVIHVCLRLHPMHNHLHIPIGSRFRRGYCPATSADAHTHLLADKDQLVTRCSNLKPGCNEAQLQPDPALAFRLSKLRICIPTRDWLIDVFGSFWALAKHHRCGPTPKPTSSQHMSRVPRRSHSKIYACTTAKPSVLDLEQTRQARMMSFSCTRSSSVHLKCAGTTHDCQLFATHTLSIVRTCFAISQLLLLSPLS